MPKKVFQVVAPGDLEIAWRGMWKDVTVTFAGRQLGGFADKKALVAGQIFALPDGSSLRVFLRQGFGDVHLDVTRNGVPVSGSGGDPKVRMNNAAGVIYFIAGLNILLSLVAELGKVGFLIRAGIGWPSLAFGVLFLGLGFATSKGSRLALGVALVLFIADGVLSLGAAMSNLGAGATPPIGPIMMRIFLIIPMIKALGAKRPAG